MIGRVFTITVSSNCTVIRVPASISSRIERRVSSMNKLPVAMVKATITRVMTRLIRKRKLILRIDSRLDADTHALRRRDQSRRYFRLQRRMTAAGDHTQFGALDGLRHDERGRGGTD